MKPRRAVTAVLALALVTQLVGSHPAESALPLIGEAALSAAVLPAGFQESTVFGGLTNPTSVRFAPDGRVFVAEKSGLIKVFANISAPTPTIFADLRTNVHNFWDRGLTGLELDPNYPASPYVYVMYTYDKDPNSTQFPRWGTAGVSSDPCPNPPGATTDGCVATGRLSRLTAGGSPPVMTGPELVLIEDWCIQSPTHTVGSIKFGPEGALYASAGDGAFAHLTDYGQFGSPLNPCGDPPAGVGGTQTPPSAEGGALRSQDLRTRSPGDPVTLDGTIIRVDPATGAAWPTNPLINDADVNARRTIAYGLRNPFRMARRPATNEIWVGDVGWDEWEEIDVVADPNDALVENFGWPCYEGPVRQAGYDAADLTICENLYLDASATTAPFYQYRHSDQVVPGEGCPVGSSSITGLAFEFNPGVGSYPPNYDGAMFFADYSRGCIWVMFTGTSGRPNPGSLKTFVDGAASPVDLQFGPGGELFYVDHVGGMIRRVQYLGTNRAPIAVATATPTSGPTPLTVGFDGRGSSDPDGDSIVFAWDLDADGAYDDSTSPTPTYTYAAAGSYPVGLKVTDAKGAVTWTSVPVAVGSVGSGNLALNRPATASSVEAPGYGYEASSAVDGNYATRWSSQFSDPQWLMVDLGGTYAITNVKLSWHDVYAKAYRIEVSNDATNWTTIYSTASGDGGVDDLTNLSGSGRYVRMYGTVRATVYSYSIYELEVYGTASGNRPPTAVIGSPGPTLTWRVNDVITFSGSASDPEDGAMPSSALSWSLVLHHCPSTCHTHELQSWPGVAGGSFSAPDHDYPSWLELTLTATDSQGLTGTSTIRLDPKTVTLNLQSSPSGLQLVVGSTAGTTAFTRTVILGSTNSVSAPSPQTIGGVTYNFVAWSDGGGRTHDIVANASATYTATFAAVPDTTPPVISNVKANGITNRAATINWATNEPASSQVQYGTTTAYGSRTPLDTALVTSHSQRLTGLAGRTTYHYRVLSMDATGNLTVSVDFTFGTK